jgi:hypothetical protein
MMIFPASTGVLSAWQGKVYAASPRPDRKRLPSRVLKKA